MKELIKFILYSILSTVIFLSIYLMVFHPGALTNMFENTLSSNSDSNIKSFNIQSDPIISSCLEDYDKYSKIGNDKYGFKYTLLNVEKVSTNDDAAEIYNLYSPPVLNFEVIKYSEPTLNYPLVIIALKIESDIEIVPLSVICNDGELTDTSIGFIILS